MFFGYAQSDNRYNSGVVLRKVSFFTLGYNAGILELRKRFCSLLRGNNFHFAEHGKNSYFAQDNSEIVPIPAMRRTNKMLKISLTACVNRTELRVTYINVTKMKRTFITKMHIAEFSFSTLLNYHRFYGKRMATGWKAI